MKNSSFHKGMIVRMKLRNFMTYDKVEMYAQPKLNFIFGPNGTGKSTFLCAVIIGLGGKPSIIGRSSNLADYIKRGCNESKIEIELYNPNGINYIITRLISTSAASCSWQMHGKTASFKQISEVIDKLNIQINNLCMILPQDRVQDFTKMNKKQLLEHTQKSVGNGDLAEIYDKLCKIRNNMKELDIELKEKAQRYEEELQVLKRMEVDVKSYRERQDTLDKIEIMKKKEAWLAYEEKSASFDQLNAESKKLFDKYEETKQLLKPFLDVISEGRKKELALGSKIKSQNKITSQAEMKQNDLKKQFLKIKSSIFCIKEDLKTKIEAEEKRETEINHLKNEITGMETSVPKKTEDVLIKEIKEVEKKTEGLLQQFSEMRLQEDQIRNYNAKINQHLKATEHRIYQAESVYDKKLGILNNDNDVKEAYNWITENRQIFSGNILGPMFIELNVKNPQNAKYIEKVIPHRDIIAFICEKPQDTTKLLTILRDKQRLKINVLNSAPPDKDLRDLYPPPVPLSDIKKYGFHNYLIDLVEGPPAVLNYLCSQIGFHKIPVGSDAVLNYKDEIPKSIKLFFSKNKFVQSRTSYYSGERLQTIMELDEPRFLEYSVDHDLIKKLTLQKENHLRDQIEGEQKEAKITEMKKTVEIELNQARNCKGQLCRDLEFNKGASVRLRLKREQLEQLQRLSFDRDAEEMATKEKISDMVRKFIEINADYNTALEDYHKSQRMSNLMQMELDNVMAKISHDEKELKSQEAQSLKLKEKTEKIKSEIVKAKTEIKMLYNKAKELTEGLDPDKPEFVKKYQNSFKKLPNKLQDLRDYLGESEAMVRCLQSNFNNKVLLDYNKKKFLLEQLSKNLEDIRTNQTVFQQEYIELKNKWLPQIIDLVSVINDKFSHSFSFLGCAGGVELDQGENKDDYENYGINIKVKFRNDSDMLLLNPFTQSGGEKALTIAVFLLSLQSVINVPFRWVDEINQGMDEYNEVRVYFLMMCEISNNPAAQYFVITPKLVEGVKMTADSTVHVIYSGEFQKKDGIVNSKNSPKPAKIRKIDLNKLKWSKKKYFDYLGI
uniref:Structural maintenance of chromosomes protein 5 n=1 Tax=Triatoma infestans TaxID=30076 RepID=A0A023EZ20_TRIIF